MLNKILSDIIGCIKGNDINYVFSTYDGKNVEKKPNDIVITVGIGEFNMKKPVYSDEYSSYPYKITAEISITAPYWCSADRLYEILCNVVIDRLTASDMNFDSIKSVSVKNDSKLKRIVYNSEIMLSGIYSIKRGESV